MNQQNNKTTQNKIFLSIETSCDETSIAILRQKNEIEQKDLNNPNIILNSFEVVSDVVSSQIEIHAQYGGVIPEIGARSHASQIHFLFQFVLDNAVNAKDEAIDFQNIASFKMTEDHKNLVKNLDSIFVTVEPGLASSLRVGQEFAKTLQDYIFREFSVFVPIVDINHLKGHVASSFYLQYPTFSQENITPKTIYPHIHLLVSGGNTQLISLKSINQFEIIGQTLDDAAGETFDKIGRMIGLPYPGGVYVSKIAGLIEENILKFPISMLQSGDYNLSYSGLKTHVRRLVESSKIEGIEFEKPLTKEEIDLLTDLDLEKLIDNKKLHFIKSVCISAQFVIIAQLFSKLNKAVLDLSPISVGISGGVSASTMLNNKIKYLADKYQLDYYSPNKKLTGDNAIMIALAGILQLEGK